MARRSSARWAALSNAPTPDLEVLIPSFERPTELAVTLAGLAAQEAPDFGVIISDQSRGRPSWEHPGVLAMVRTLRAQGHDVELLRHVPARGLAEHRQFLLDNSTASRVLYLDDDVWLEPGALERMASALETLKCGFVGMAPQGLSYLDEPRPEEVSSFQRWDGTVEPEQIRPGSPEFQRWPLHSAANLAHLSHDLGVADDAWLAYRIAWVGGCVLYNRAALVETGGFNFWQILPANHAGEDVLAQWKIMERFGGAGILPSGAVHLESPTTVPNRSVEAHQYVLNEEALLHPK